MSEYRALVKGLWKQLVTAAGGSPAVAAYLNSDERSVSDRLVRYMWEQDSPHMPDMEKDVLPVQGWIKRAIVTDGLSALADPAAAEAKADALAELEAVTAKFRGLSLGGIS